MKRRITAGLLACSMGIMMAGCGAAGGTAGGAAASTAGSAPEAPAEKATITIWSRDSTIEATKAAAE